MPPLPQPAAALTFFGSGQLVTDSAVISATDAGSITMVHLQRILSQVFLNFSQGRMNIDSEEGLKSMIRKAYLDRGTPSDSTVFGEVGVQEQVVNSQAALEAVQNIVIPLVKVVVKEVRAKAQDPGKMLEALSTGLATLGERAISFGDIENGTAAHVVLALQDGCARKGVSYQALAARLQACGGMIAKISAPQPVAALGEDRFPGLQPVAVIVVDDTSLPGTKAKEQGDQPGKQRDGGGKAGSEEELLR